MGFTQTVYIEFLYPDSFTGRRRTEVIRSREVSEVRVPRQAHGFRFFDIISAIVAVEGQHVMLTSERLKVSPVHYYGGELYTLSEMEHQFPNEFSYFINIGEVHSRKILRCRTGNWVIPRHDDKLINVTECPYR